MVFWAKAWLSEEWDSKTESPVGEWFGLEMAWQLRTLVDLEDLGSTP